MYLTVIRAGKKEKLLVKAGETILTALMRNDIYLSTPCGGKGTCGKCRIRTTKGRLPVTEADKSFLTEEEIQEGFRIACRAHLEENLTIELAEESEFEVLTEPQSESGTVFIRKTAKEISYAVAIDIGTTTIALAMIATDTGQTVRTMGELNRQRSYGADVVSRIAAANEGAAEELTGTIRKQLREMVKRLDIKQLSGVTIAANTTMCHILMGYSCETLGAYPFQPVCIQTIHTDTRELFGEEVPYCNVTILPGISTYVGADMVSGLVECGFSDSDEVSILIDLGTNGEMAIGNKERILVTSAAAGPAFEGGNITFGTGSVPGAIQAVQIQYGRAKVQTIQNKTPVGICGSGVVELTAELLLNGLIDETGTLDKAYLETGYPVAMGMAGQIVFTQKDIREIQMAKSAVYSALSLLTKRYGIQMEQVDKVFLAGGFGFHVNIEKAAAIGLIPKQWKDRIVVAGNTALQGAKHAVLDRDWIKKAELLGKAAEELSLAMDSEFNKLYTEHMFFDEVFTSS